MIIDKNSKIYVSGHNGMVGSAICRKLIDKGYLNILTKNSKDLDLRIQSSVEDFFKRERPDVVILAAAKVGGIMSNISYPAEYLYDNIMIQSNVINAAYKNNVYKLIFFGSSCIYPKDCPQPMKEEYLLTGKVEPTNEGFAIAKITGMKMCEMYNRQYGTNYISVMPCNMYGSGDDFDSLNSHVIPAIISKIYKAKINKLPKVVIWGTGNPRREFMYVDDMADACVYLMETYSDNSFINIGTGKDISIKELSYMIKDIIEYEGELFFDETKPDGLMRKMLDVSKLTNKGWVYKTELKEGLEKTYQWYLDNFINI